MIAGVTLILPLASPLLSLAECYYSRSNRGQRNEASQKNIFCLQLAHAAAGTLFTAYHISATTGATLGVVTLWSALNVRRAKEESIPDLCVGLLPKLACSVAIGAWAKVVSPQKWANLSGWAAGLSNVGLALFVATHGNKSKEGE